jgi:hypothetical protein
MQLRLLLLVAVCGVRSALAVEVLAGTAPLTVEGDLSAQMVAGIGRYLDRENEKARAERLAQWKSRDAKEADATRALLRERLGMRDTPIKGAIEVVQPLGAKPIENDRFEMLHIRWPVFERVSGEGLPLQARFTGRPAHFVRVGPWLSVAQFRRP